MKYLKYMLSLLLVVTISSCDEFLTESPQQSLPLEGGISTVEDIENLLNGAYNDVQDGDIIGSQSLVFSEITTDNTVWTGSFPTYVNISELDMDPTNGSIAGQWNDYFDATNSLNIILANIGDIDDPNLTDQRADAIRGQALFLRGLLYFSGVRYFGLPWSTGNNSSNLGLPIRTEPVASSDDFQNPSRATVAETYAQAVGDLQEAANLLPPGGLGEGRANSLAATALLSRIRLGQAQYPAAADLAGQVISSGNFSLDESVLPLWRTEQTGEQIFSIIHTPQDNPGINNSLPAFYAIQGRDDIQISQSFLDAADEIVNDRQQATLDAAGQTVVDTRISLLVSVGDDGVPTASIDNSLKYDDGISTADNAVVIRYPEMLLTRAEGLARTSTTVADVPQEVFNLVNQVRRRALVVNNAAGEDASSEAAIDYTRADFASLQELIDAIVLERRIELAFEGQRLWDLLRLRMSVKGMPFDSDRITFPIPQTEIDANPNIEQNNAYDVGGS
jgi:hypothetical protein